MVHNTYVVPHTNMFLMLLQSEGLKGAKFKIMTFFSLKCVPLLSLSALSSKIRAEDPQIYYGKASQT